MRKKILSYAGNTTLIIGVALGAYALVDIYLLQSKLPDGVCPVTSNRPILYIAIAFACLSFILSFFEPKALKNKDKK